MEIIKANHKEYQVVRTIREDCFECERKNKKYFIRKFFYYCEEGQFLAYQVKKLSTSGINVPKLYGIDKKNGYIVSEYLEGENLMQILSKEDINDQVFEQLFNNAYLAKRNKVTLNYEPDKWLLSNGKLFYTYPIYIKYDDKKDLALKYLALYFNTPELAEFMKRKQIPYDKKRIKPAYDTNRAMVLTTCKFYK